MKIKTTMRYHFIPTRITIMMMMMMMMIIIVIQLVEMQRNWNPQTSLLGIQNVHFGKQFGTFFLVLIVVQVQLSPFLPPPFSPTPLASTSHPQSYPPLALSTGPSYVLLEDPSSSFPHYPIPAGYCQFVLYFNVSGYIFTCLFVLLTRFHL